MSDWMEALRDDRFLALYVAGAAMAVVLVVYVVLEIERMNREVAKLVEAAALNAARTSDPDGITAQIAEIEAEIAKLEKVEKRERRTPPRLDAWRRRLAKAKARMERNAA